MRVFFNDLSVEGQFGSIQEFKSAFSEIMKMKVKANGYGYKLECSKRLFEREIYDNRYFPTVLDEFSNNQKKVILLWVTKQGPFWEDEQTHSENDYVTIDGREELFNGDTICELTVLRLKNTESCLVSILPSSWCINPLNAIYHHDDENSDNVAITNFWKIDTFSNFLDSIGYNIVSWDQLEQYCNDIFSNLTFSKVCFRPLFKLPFIKTACDKIINQLSILNDLCINVDDNGALNAKGNELHDKYFVGDNALFTDSSETEKRDYKNSLTFKNPDNPGEDIFCTMHGKISTRHIPIRLHFDWNNKKKKLLYVTYIGQKITKK